MEIMALQDLVISPPKQDLIITLPKPTADDRGWRVMEDKGMPPRGTLRTPDQQRLDQMFTGGTLGGAPPAQSLPSFRDVAEYYNVGTEGAPFSVLGMADLTMERPEDYARLLSSEDEFGEQVSVYMHPELNELVYKHPTTGREEIIVNPTSITQGLKANPAAIAQFGAEIMGGLAGYTGGSIVSLGAAGPFGAAVGSAAAAFLSRMTRLKAGELAGANTYTRGEMVLGGLTDAMYVLAGAGLGEAGGAIFRRMVASPQVKRYILSLSEKEADVFEAALKSSAKDIQEEFGVDLTVGQVLQKSKKVPGYITREVRTAEERLLADSAELRAIKTVQQQRLGELGGKIEDVAAPDTIETALKAPEITEEIADIATKNVDDQIIKLKSDRDTALAEYEADLTNILDSPELVTRGDQIGAYEQMTTALSDARSKVFGKEGVIGAQYTKFWDRVGEPKVSLDEVRMVGEKHGSKLESDLYPSLANEDANIVRDALGGGLKKDITPAIEAGVSTTTMARTAATPEQTIVSDAPVTMASVNRALSVIKEELRKTPDVRRGEKSFLIDIKNALSNVRDRALSMVDKNAARELKEIDTLYAKTATDMDTAQINRVLKTNEQGSFVTPVATAIKSLIGNKGLSAEAFMRMAKDSTSPIYGSLGTVRTAIRSLYRDAMEGKVGTARFGAHKAFMKANGDGIKRILTPDEYRGFTRGSHDAMEAMKREENIASTAIRRIEKSFEGRLTKADNFDNLVDMVKGSKSPIQDTKKIVNLLKGNKELLDQYKGLRARRMVNDMQSTDDLGNKVFDFGKMDTLLSSTKELGELKTLYGNQFIVDLRLIKDLSLVENVPGAVGLSADMQRLISEGGHAGAALMAWRGLVARPLSRAGLLTTSALKLESRGAREALGKLLSNPTLFLTAMGLYRRNAPLEKWRTVLTNVGLANLLGDDE